MTQMAMGKFLVNVSKSLFLEGFQNSPWQGIEKFHLSWLCFSTRLHHRLLGFLPSLNNSFTNIVIDEGCTGVWMSNSNQRDNSAEPQNNVQKIYYPLYADLWQANQSNKTILEKCELETALTFSYWVVTLRSPHFKPLGWWFHLLIRFISNVVFTNINNKKNPTIQ